MLRQRKLVFLLCSLVFLLGPAMAKASDLTLERALQQNFKKSRVLLAKMERELASGKSYQNSLTELKGLGETIRTDHQALLAQLDARGGQMAELGASAVARHAAMQERYEFSLSQYLSSVAALSDGQVTLDAIHQLQTILAEILPEKQHRIHGSVPYRHLNLPARRPVATPEVVPAYKGGTAPFAGADLEGSPEAPISLPIASLAQSLNWNPVLIYEWVKNNIKTEWYWGAMKGAEETLHQMSGNDADQAALLVALFRSAGFPARYVRGVMEFFPDIEAAKEQTGLADPLAIARFFQKAGVPYETVIAGGRISNFRIEHVWVEVEIPYDNYRGALLDEHGAAWLALDTSIKTAGYAANTPAESLTTLDLAGVRESYLADFKAEPPMEYLAAQINAQLAGNSSGATYADLLQTRTINQEHMQIIPAGLQFKEIAVTGEYASLPAELLHQARFIAKSIDGTVLFDQALPLPRLSNRSLAVTFEPETIEDQEIMNAYGGMDNTPLYLIRLRPVLTVAGGREIIGQDGLAAGADFTLAVELVAPGVRERVENTLVAGYPALIGLAAQQAVLPATIPLAQKNAARLLFERAMSYIDQGNKAEEELAALLRMQIARPLPTLVTLGGVLEVVTLLDAPHGFTWQGLYLDADLRVVEPMGGMAPAGADPGALFMEMAALQSSVLEHRVFEEGFGVESVSTAKLLALANREGLPVAVLDAANAATDLPALHLPDSIAADIAGAMNQGLVVTLPATEMTHEDWTGYAYLKENPATSESGWMLAGEIAGGMTALNPEHWPEEYYDIMTHPGTESSDDPASAVELKVIRGPDTLTGVAGRQLARPLQIIALDAAGTPVRGVEVRFAVKAGGARVSKPSLSSWQSEVLIKTDYDGIASVDVLFNESTSINPTTARRSTDKASQRVDETAIEITSSSGLRTAAPVSVFGFPDAPHHLRVTGGNSTGPILTWAATLIASVEDQYNNPRSGEQVDFAMGAARPGSECGSATSTRPGLLIAAEDPCMANIPVYGQCGSGSVTGMTGLHLGAAAHVLLGDRPDADYPVTVSSGALSEQVTVTASPVGPCDPEDSPYSALVLRVIHDTDAQGNIISAGPVSTREKTVTVPLLARLYAFREQGTEVPKEIPCLPSGTDTCPVWQGTGVYEIATDFVSASVSFDGTEAEPLGNGLYRVDYPLAFTPKKHDINVTGTAMDKEKINVHVCDDRNDCQLTEVDKPIDPVSHSATAYAVAVIVPQEQHIIPVNEDGYVTADYPLTYTIEPPEYTAATVDVVLSEKNNDGVFEEIAYFSAETSGQGEMTFLTGFRFEQEKEYRAQVVLNEGSDSMEIRSKEMTIQPLTLELDADLNRDGMWKEDDPLEHTAPGLVIPFNLDDDDSDGVPDNIDGSNADGIAGNADDAMAMADVAYNTLTPVQDDDLIEVKLRALPADLVEGTVTLEILQGAELVKIWTDPQKGADNLLIDGLADPATASKTWVLGTNVANLSELPQSLYIEGIDASLDRDDTAILVAKYHSAADPAREVELDRLLVAVLPSVIVPDYNRDGKINDLDRDKVTKDKPWRFWVNDDDDKDSDPITGLTTDIVIAKPDDLPSQNEDNSDNQVNGIRDLLDFFPLYLDIGKALEFWPPAGGYEYVIKDSANPAEGVSGLAMAEGRAGAHVLSADSVNKYLEDPEVAVEFASSEVKSLAVDGVPLSSGFLEKVKSSVANGIILLEGRKPWGGQITLEISKNGTFVHIVSLPLEITGVEEMFGHKNLRAVAGATDGDPDRYVEFDPKTNKLYVGKNQEIGKQPYCMQGEDKSLVWMHGYNVNPESARATFAEVFKRFFHAGLTGRFYGVSWYGDPPDGSPIPQPHYHEAVVNAFATAGEYSRFINFIPGSTSITAHSLGNMVAGSAIQDHNLENFAKYFAIDAAVALEAYGQVVDVEDMANLDGSFSEDPNSDMIRVETWPEYIAKGQSRLLASEWYKLFENLDPPDNRRELTWRNRLGSVPSEKVYNFYSSTEDVLRRFAGDNLVTGLSGEALAIAAFVKQEKFKGRRSILNPADDISGVSSNYCGWNFNGHYWKFSSSPPDYRRHYTPEEAAIEISDNALRAEPFFALDNRHLFPNPQSLLDPGLDELVSAETDDPAPSALVKKKVSETGLTNYYEDNKAAHQLVTVRDWLLAEAFPATTLPMGANKNNIFRDMENQNIDMSADKDNNGCKTSEDLWPRRDTYQGIREWRHSDYKNIPYQHVFEFYKIISQR